MERNDELLTPAQLRARLGISQATYFRWLRDGRLKGVMVGRRRRFEPSLLNELREDPQSAQQRKGALAASVDLCVERLIKLGIKRKELAAMLANSKSEAESIANLLIAHALKKGAADLHLEPVADGLSVRERIHGILRKVDSPLPQAAQGEVVRAIKDLAGMQQAVTNLPQDARFFADFEGRKVDVHCSVYPTALGESITLRLLDPARVSLSFGLAGFSKHLNEAVLAAVRPGRGVFIANGPTGCGKTTTLYCLLNELNKPGVKIMTIEDPVEFMLDGIQQARWGESLTFPRAMRAMLRADVDIGFVGEMRDQESLQLLYTMANTGHKMFTALHAVDAITALSRVLEFGKVPPQYVADCTLGILNQRLFPKSCPKCRTLGPLTRAEAAALGLSGEGHLKVAHNSGCTECDKTGVLGRAAVGELLTITPALRKAILAGATAVDDLRSALPPEYQSLRENVLERLRAGEMTPDIAAQILG